MSDDNKAYRAGEAVPDGGEYICEICHTEGGTDAKMLAKGAKFPECMNCGHATSWVKLEKKD